MALCGMSTETFFRLWTRAPWTRKMSGSGCNPSVDALICFVAKREPRQQLSKPRPKLQIIKPLSKASKPRFRSKRYQRGLPAIPRKTGVAPFGGTLSSSLKQPASDRSCAFRTVLRPVRRGRLRGALTLSGDDLGASLASPGHLSRCQGKPMILWSFALPVRQGGPLELGFLVQDNLTDSSADLQVNRRR